MSIAPVVCFWQKCLDSVPGVQTVVYSNGWPADANAFEGADAMVLSMDGGSGHAALQGRPPANNWAS